MSERLSEPRRCAYRVLRRVSDEGAFADRAFRAEADRAELPTRDRAFAQQLAFGTVQRRTTLDFLLGQMSSRPAADIDPPLRDALRLGLFQLVYLGGVPDHAAVQQTVENAKLDRGQGHRFANAVMRRAAREARPLLAGLKEDSPAEAAVLHSHPGWLVRLWWNMLGRADTVALLRTDNTAPERAVRVNELLGTAAEAREALAREGVPSHPAQGVPEGLVLDRAYDLPSSRLFKEGLLMPQSRASMLVGRVVDPKPGEQVLDLCAAPGAKTTHLAALMQASGRHVAVERHPGRSRMLERTCRRMGAPHVDVRRQGAGDPITDGPFDRVLLDPPCSDLGTLQARPDARWRKDPRRIGRLVEVQRDLLESAAVRVRPGGVLVYSTCTISPAENEEQVLRFLDGHPDFAAEDLGRERPELRHAVDGRFLQTLPHRHGTDGFFVARLRRQDPA